LLHQFPKDLQSKLPKQAKNCWIQIEAKLWHLREEEILEEAESIDLWLKQI
jgi:hypothetical protein